MPKSYRSFDDGASGVDGPANTDQSSYSVTRRHSDELDEDDDGAQTPRSPLWMRRTRSKARFVDESSSLLDNVDNTRPYQTRNISTPGTPRTLRTPGIRRQHSYNASARHHQRAGSWGHGFSTRLVNALMSERNNNINNNNNIESSGMVTLFESFSAATY
jgi:hypothetical protein